MVRSSVATAERLCVSPLINGMTLVGFGTSTPELVREYGIYEQPSAKVAAMMELLSFARDTWFLILSAAVVGFAFGLWADAIMKRRELAGQSTKNDDQARAVDSAPKIIFDDGVPFEKRLFVSQPSLNKSMLKAERIVHISIISFNGNKEPIVILGSGGQISIEYGDSVREMERRDLPAPAIPASIEVGRERRPFRIYRSCRSAGR